MIQVFHITSSLILKYEMKLGGERALLSSTSQGDTHKVQSPHLPCDQHLALHGHRDSRSFTSMTELASALFPHTHTRTERRTYGRHHPHRAVAEQLSGVKQTVGTRT